MDWILITFKWYVYLLVLGIIFFPITKFFLGKVFIDQGYAFSKTVAIIAVSYVIFVLGVLKILPFTQASLFGIVGFFALITFLNSKKMSISKDIRSRKTLLIILFEEILFFIALYAWVYIRGQEPSIRGLEKFMDFGFINSAIRSEYFPPKDMWLAGSNINYYYFGHLTGAVLAKLSSIPSFKTYNLILSTIFALGITQVFSLCMALIDKISDKIKIKFIGGILGMFVLNFAGNLHTIYLFTKGYDTEKPVPFWQIISNFTPEKYWYPNATRFIPFTIHEFPIYSYVVADLHGHVFDIPFILLTLAFLLVFIQKNFPHIINKRGIEKNTRFKFSEFKPQIAYSVLFGFMSAVHYMTNAFDGPIYLLLSIILFFLIYKLTLHFFVLIISLIGSFVLFALPFSANFSPFVSGIGINCAPSFLTNIKRLGPFLFESGNCQISPWWMLIILWGFFWFNFLFFLISISKNKRLISDYFILAFFSLGTFLIIIPEFFYIKDIYPAHFRANTMFKLGYQAFMMMSIASIYTFFAIKKSGKKTFKIIYTVIFGILFTLIAIYPRFSIISYYGGLQKQPVLDGTGWITYTYADYKPIIGYLNSVPGQPNILEAQGDSYTDFNVVSAYTGLPTIAGWWVHEWLWRGDSSVVGNLIPSVQNVYEGTDLTETKKILKTYNIQYIVIGTNEKKKYPKLNLDKLSKLGETVVETPEKSILIKVL